MNTLDSTINSTVPALSFVTMGIAILFGFLIPAVLFLILKKKYDCKKLPFFVGCATFFIAAIVLEGLVHTIILGGGRAEILMAKPVLYGLYGGFMAGLFEETGRFIAYTIILKKGREKYSDNKTALAYGAGHGGFEAFYILVVSMITNLVFGIMINTGNTEVLFNGLDATKAAATQNVLNQLVTTTPLTYLVSVIERFGAVAFHMAASVMVWFAVKNKKFWLYPVAILLHMILDMLAVIGMQFGLPIVLIEVFLYLYSGFCIFIAWKIWRKSELVLEN